MYIANVYMIFTVKFYSRLVWVLTLCGYRIEVEAKGKQKFIKSMRCVQQVGDFFYDDYDDFVRLWHKMFAGMCRRCGGDPRR